jgi:Resolvase, N terminal domain
VRAQGRAALYHWVSTLDQNSTLARAELRAAAKRFGHWVVLDVEEAGSGARNDRPGSQRVTRAARRGEVDVLLVFKLDRAGRSAHGRRRDQPASHDGARRGRGVRARPHPRPYPPRSGGSASPGGPPRPTSQAGTRSCGGQSEACRRRELDSDRHRARMQHRESPTSRRPHPRVRENT